MEERIPTYTIFRRIERITDLRGLCPMENEAAFVTLQNFGRTAFGMYWSTEEMAIIPDIPSFAEMKRIVIPRVGSENGHDVLAYTWPVCISEYTSVMVAAIEDEVLDRIDEL